MYPFKVNDLLQIQGFRFLRLQPCLSVAVCLLLCSATFADAFSVRWDRPLQPDTPDELQEPHDLDYDNYKEKIYNGSEPDEEEIEEGRFVQKRGIIKNVMLAVRKI